MGIELVGCRPHWTGPPCEIGISRRSVYQMTASREQAQGEGNCGRATERGKEACAWLGNVMSKSDAVRTLHPTRMHSHQICEATKRIILQGRIGQASEPNITNPAEISSLSIEFQWKQEGPNNEEQGRAIKRLVAREPPHAKRPELTGLRTYEDHRFNRPNG
jgi:hypothetical protein